jgi:hypothetical protein
MISIPELGHLSNSRPFGMFETSINGTITVNIGDMTDVGQFALSQVAAFASVVSQYCLSCLIIVTLSLPMNNFNGTIPSQVLRSTHLGKKWVEKL